jgi:hypothetical protein
MLLSTLYDETKEYIRDPDIKNKHISPIGMAQETLNRHQMITQEVSTG